MPKKIYPRPYKPRVTGSNPVGSANYFKLLRHKKSQGLFAWKIFQPYWGLHPKEPYYTYLAKILANGGTLHIFDCKQSIWYQGNYLLTASLTQCVPGKKSFAQGNCGVRLKSKTRIKDK